MDEIYRPLYNINPAYEVSNTGKVRKRAYTVRYNEGDGFYVPEVDIPVLDQPNLKWVSVRINNQQLGVHRLVADAFLPNPNNKKYVVHIDGDYANNCVDNLMWADKKNNLFDSIQKSKDTFGYRKGMHCKCLETNQVFVSYKAAAEYFHISYPVFVYHVNSRKPIDGKTFITSSEEPNVFKEDYS